MYCETRRERKGKRMGLLTFKGGIHPNDGKSLAKDQPITQILPKGQLVYPLSQHIGAPATPVVKKGDRSDIRYHFIYLCRTGRPH